MEAAWLARFEATEAVRFSNPDGTSPFVLTCDHASNHVPAQYGTLGLTAADLLRHIAWDPGALAVARLVAKKLDATLVEARISRLVIDCNRPLDAPDLISEISESTPIPGNIGLSQSEREARIRLAWKPYHDAVEALIEARLSEGRDTRLIAIHSFTPVYKDVARPWQVGVIHDEDTRLAAPLIKALKANDELPVGVNEPYSPADRVYFTLERHARSRGLPCAMIEIRNDEIADEAGQEKWAAILAEAIAVAQRAMDVEAGRK